MAVPKNKNNRRIQRNYILKLKYRNKVYKNLINNFYKLRLKEVKLNLKQK